MAMHPRTPSSSAGHLATLLKKALAWQQQGKRQKAQGMYQRILDADPRNFDALRGMGIMYAEAGQWEKALRYIAQTVAVQPSNFAAHFNQGKVLQGLGRLEEALSCYDRALALRPDYAGAYNNRGNVLKDLHRRREALDSYANAIALQPDYVNAYYNLSNTLLLEKRHEEALSGYDRVLALNPKLASAHGFRGIVLSYLNRYEEALASFDRAIALDPRSTYIHGDRIHAQMCIGAWDRFEERLAAIVRLLDQGIPASQPFPLLATPADRKTLQKAAALVVADKCPPAAHPLWMGEAYGHQRIRLGYFSADLHSHATAYLMAELFEKHDRARFEIIAFSLGPDVQDDMRPRLVKAFDQFHEVSAKSDHDIAAQARALEIDIAVDLKGLTHDCRPGIFALRPAPLQVNYLGFPGTMSAPYMDYILADAVIIPAEHFTDYSEKVVHLPHAYQPNDSQRRIAETTPPRTALGLPETGFVFCCFNNNYKITPDVFAIWMRLLAHVEDSVLWLLEDNPAFVRNLRQAAQTSGIAPERLIFAPRILLSEHLARQRRADLFLDTFYCNAHTTASDALWSGLPLITCLGDTFAARVAASLLQAVGLPELITRNPADYETLALQLATDPTSLAAIKQRLAQNRLTLPLFDSALFTRHIEAAYTAMHQRHCQGLQPDHIHIPP